jgi:hypothetical protein
LAVRSNSPQLDARHIARLEHIAAHGFRIVAFPMYASAVGVRKGNCAALLSPQADGTLSLLSGPHYLIDGNLGVRLERGGHSVFVWKTKEVAATPERVAELVACADQLGALLGRDATPNPGSRSKPP